MPTDSTSLAAALTHAHRTGAALAPDHLPAPADLDAAFATQAQLAHALDATVVGWKAGFGPDQVPIAAPLYRAYAAASGAALTLPRRAPLIVEVEIGFRLGRDLPPRPRQPYARAEVEDAVGAVLIGFELIASRFGDHLKHPVPLPAFLADNLGNAGYVAGEARTDWRELALASLRCTLDVNGERTHDKAGGHPQSDPLLPLLAWANAQRDGLGGLKAGQIVTTGSLTPVAQYTSPARLEARVEGIGAVLATLVR